MIAAGLGFLISFILIFFGVPIAISLFVVGFGGIWAMVGYGPALSMLPIVTRDSTMSYSLSVIPLFVLMGSFVSGAGISNELYRAARTFVGHRRGGLAAATIIACGGFSTVSGSSLATVVTIGKVALPSMRSYKYSDGLSTAVISAGATLGIIIPPSVLLVIYGIMTETHIGKLYAAGFIPGILGIVGYILAIQWVVRRNPWKAPPSERANWAERIASLRDIWAVVLLMAIVLGGIYAGIFTAAEAAGVGAFGAFLLSWFKGKIGWRKIYEILLDTAQTTAILFTMLIGAMFFTEFLNYTGSHEALLRFVQQSNFSPFTVISIICVIYIILGALMDELSMILLTVPIFFPVVIGLGYDPVWFGILVIVLCEVGMICPPIGINLFVMRTVAPDVPLGLMMRSIVPFVVADIVRVFLIAGFPILALVLPNLMFG